MKKNTLLDMLESLSRAHALTEYNGNFMPENSKERSMNQGAKFNIGDCLTAVKMELQTK